ncbi:arachidonate 5-lipoxygenase-activating protein [Conger conger]|uniref:arachidonate 5-lipoxygenase-activating protein n=1 Tax=Conger conger TaxID=82655 RepID=UPI002A5A623F|nr:arachidonate 5-lipoxygenase-activating protein [Conger conger]
MEATEANVMENIFLLVLVTLMSALQNVFFARKMEREGTTDSTKTAAFERVSCANRNCMDAYPTFIAVMWCAGICLSQAPAAFAGLVYLFARQKYFVGYMGQSTQSTPGFLFGKRVLSFLFLMSIIGVLSHLLSHYLGADYKEYIQTVTKAASTLLLLP